MKHPFLFLWSMIFILATSLGLGAKNLAFCPDKAEITSPKVNQIYSMGKDMNIILKSTNCALVNNATLYFNGQYISKQHGPNVVWSHTSFRFLKNMQQGTYNIKIRVKEYNGQTYDLEMSFKVRGLTLHVHNPKYCVVANPLQNLSWLRTIKRNNSNVEIREYTRNVLGKRQTYFSVRPCKGYRDHWYDCSGSIVRNTTRSWIRSLKLVKTLYKGCP